jgi:hypothetical protein
MCIPAHPEEQQTTVVYPADLMRIDRGQSTSYLTNTGQHDRETTHDHDVLATIPQVHSTWLNSVLMKKHGVPENLAPHVPWVLSKKTLLSRPPMRPSREELV